MTAFIKISILLSFIYFSILPLSFAMNNEDPNEARRIERKCSMISSIRSILDYNDVEVPDPNHHEGSPVRLVLRRNYIIPHDSAELRGRIEANDIVNQQWRDYLTRDRFDEDAKLLEFLHLLNIEQ